MLISIEYLHNTVFGCLSFSYYVYHQCVRHTDISNHMKTLLIKNNPSMNALYIKQRKLGNEFKSSLNFALNKDFQFVKE